MYSLKLLVFEYEYLGSVLSLTIFSLSIIVLINIYEISWWVDLKKEKNIYKKNF